MRDRLSWRSFVGLGLQDPVPDETTLVGFRQRLQENRLHESLLDLVNKQLEAKGLILKTCTLVDAARRAPSKNGTAGCDPDASYTVKRGEPHYGYKAHIAIDREHNLIRSVRMTGAHVHDSVEFDCVVKGDERMVIADKAYWGRKRSEWCKRMDVTNGIIQRAVRGKKLRDYEQWLNRGLSKVRCQIEQVFGWWKRSVGYWRVRYLGRKANRLELEFKSICWNLKRTVNLVSE